MATKSSYNLKNWLPVVVIGITLIWFIGIEVLYPKSKGQTMAMWSFYAWNTANDFLHGRIIPIAFIIFTILAWKKMRLEEIKPSFWGIFIVLFGIALYLASKRTLQPRLALIGLPFIITGATQFLFGWKVTRLMLFPAFFWYFAIPLPGIQQATNFLQVFVTDACYVTGKLVGIDLVNTGDQIRHATKDWDVEIAAGCSGIRSLMSLVMISAIYGYYTQRENWKKIVIFVCAIPLAVVGNFFRVFTIIVLCNMGYEETATGLYHDYAGMFIFFPIALMGLMLIDTKLLNRSKKKLKVTKKNTTIETEQK